MPLSGLYMKEFMLGLGSYGLDQMIIQNPLVCQPLFVAGNLKEDVTPEADCLFSLLEPRYTRNDTSRQCFEEDIMDFIKIFSDCETGYVVGHQAPIAYNYSDEEGNTDKNEATCMNQDESLVFESPSLSVPGIMGWFTGSQHKPISGKRFKISVYFTCALLIPSIAKPCTLIKRIVLLA